MELANLCLLIFVSQLRSRNPVCVFLDPTLMTALNTNWSTGGLFTDLITGTSGAEFRQFDVTCSSTHLTAFAVAVEETTMVCGKCVDY